MRVQQVLMPGGEQSWTVLDDEGEPVPVAEAFLAHLQALDRSPTTVRTYATSLKLWLEFLSRIGVAVDEASVDHVSRFVAWLRAPAENVTVLAGGTGRCTPATGGRGGPAADPPLLDDHLADLHPSRRRGSSRRAGPLRRMGRR